jgi:hypothetical protein
VRCYTNKRSQLAKCDVEQKHGEAAAFETSQLPLVQFFCFGVTGACLHGTAARSDQLHAKAKCHVPETAHNCFLCQVCPGVPGHTAFHENIHQFVIMFLPIAFFPGPQYWSIMFTPESCTFFDKTSWLES